jgi:uncharacterized protein YjdB
VATVADGLVTAVRLGQCIITATETGSGLSGTAYVAVVVTPQP